MAEFSKQWCEAFDPEGLLWDFDIYEVTKDLQPGYCVHLVCEGYGFSAIGKSVEGVVQVFVQDWNTGEGRWHDFDDYQSKYRL